MDRYTLSESAKIIDSMESTFERTVAKLVRSRPKGFKAELAAAGLDPAQCRGKDWRGVNFDGEDLSGVDFSHADLRGCSFQDVDLGSVEMFRAQRDEELLVDYLLAPRAAVKSPPNLEGLMKNRDADRYAIDAALGDVIAYGFHCFESGMYKLSAELNAWVISYGHEIDYFNLDRARHDEAKALTFAGLHQESLQRVKERLRHADPKEFRTDANLLAWRYLEAQLLHKLDESERALELVQGLVPDYELARGENHEHVFTSRCLEIQILTDLNEHKMVADILDDLLPKSRQFLGDTNATTLVLAYSEARLLNEMGEAESALEKANIALKVEREAYHIAHPNFLRTRWLRATILTELDQSDEALTELRRILPLQVKAMSEQNRHVRETREWIAKLQAAQAERPTSEGQVTTPI
ncbi:MAG: pentapeptide repeat-containing protein [Pseudomonadota bacterium]